MVSRVVQLCAPEITVFGIYHFDARPFSGSDGASLRHLRRSNWLEESVHVKPSSPSLNNDIPVPTQCTIHPNTLSTSNPYSSRSLHPSILPSTPRRLTSTSLSHRRLPLPYQQPLPEHMPSAPTAAHRIAAHAPQRTPQGDNVRTSSLAPRRHPP